MEQVIPRTMAELMSTHDRYITGCIFKVSRGCVRQDDVEDLKQQILTRIHETGYLKKYDPSKGSFNSFLFWLVRSVVCNQFDKNTRNPLNTALGVIERDASRSKSADSGLLVLETLRGFADEDFERTMHARRLCDQFEAHLTKVGASRAKRSLVQVFRLLRQSFDTREIADALGVSESTVFSYLKRLRAEAQVFQVRVGRSCITSHATAHAV